MDCFWLFGNRPKKERVSVGDFVLDAPIDFFFEAIGKAEEHAVLLLLLLILGVLIASGEAIAYSYVAGCPIAIVVLTFIAGHIWRRMLRPVGYVSDPHPPIISTAWVILANLAVIVPAVLMALDYDGLRFVPEAQAIGRGVIFGLFGLIPALFWCAAVANHGWDGVATFMSTLFAILLQVTVVALGFEDPQNDSTALVRTAAFGSFVVYNLVAWVIGRVLAKQLAARNAEWNEIRRLEKDEATPVAPTTTKAAATQ